MNKQKILSISIILFLAISLFAAIFSAISQNGGNNDPQDELNPVELYKKAAKKILQADSLSLSISTATNIKRGDEIYTETSNETLLYNNMGNTDMVSHSLQTKTYDDYEITIEKIYKNDVVYYTIAHGAFLTRATQEEYLSGNLPAVLLNETLYESILIESEDNPSEIKFSQPKKAESWALPQDAELTEASGTAKLISDNALQTIYELTYQLDGAEIMEIFRVDATISTQKITPPNADKYLPISDIAPLLLMEQSVGYLHQADKVTATTQQDISSEATGHTWSQTSILNFYNTDNSCTVQQDITTTVVDRGDDNASTTKTQSIVYADNKYTSTIDAEKPVHRTDVTDDAMRTYCRDNLVSTILMSKHITSIEEKNEDGIIALSFTANEDMADTMCQNAWQILFGNPNYISHLETVKMTGHIYIDKATLLPVQSGVSYNGAYSKDNHNYHLIFNAEQKYAFPS